LWTNRYSGPVIFSHDYPSAVAVDRSGNVFVTGHRSVTPRYATIAYSNDGLTLWTYSHDGGYHIGPAIAVDGSGNVFVTGESYGSIGSEDFVTIKYSSSRQLHLAIARDGSGGLFVRYTGAPDVTYRLQRAASVTGPWSDLATNTAPASGLVEFHEATPLLGQAFYRTVQP
jgi:hypothetical protein